MSLARWAQRRNLLEEADEVLRTWLRRHPEDEAAYELSLEIAEDRRLSSDSEPFKRTRAILGRAFIKHETARFVVLSDAGTSFTRSQAERLERAHHQFQRFAKRHDLHPLPLQHKLVCVLFGSRDEYHAFAAAHDGLNNPSIAGYYSPRHDRMVFYDPASNPGVSRAGESLNEVSNRIRRLERELVTVERVGDDDDATSLRTALASWTRQYDRERARIDEFIERTTISTTIHEAIHHLMYHTNVQKPTVQYPLWVSEGLATTFETDRPNQAFGPRHEYTPRREMFTRLLREDKLIPLPALVVMTRLPAEDDDVQALYHQSYALMTWLTRFRRDEFGMYLRLMRREPHGRPTAGRQLELFREAFGDVEKLERIWLGHEHTQIALAHAGRRFAEADDSSHGSRAAD